MPYPIRIQVLIKENTKYGEYNDALYFTQDEYYSLTEDDITKQIFQRVFNWADSIENAPEPVPPTKEELIAQQQSLLEQKAQIEAQVAELDSRIAEKNGNVR